MATRWCSRVAPTTRASLLVTLNGVPLFAGVNVSVQLAAGRGLMDVVVLSTHSVWCRVGNFELQLDNSDLFVNLVGLRVLKWHKMASHGLIGQTWRRPAKPGKVRYIHGDVDDYVEANNDLLGTAILYGQSWIKADEVEPVS